MYTSRLYGIPLLPQWDLLSWTIDTQVSFENLAIAGGDRPFPVIVFSHGTTASAVDNVYTLEALASFGFKCGGFDLTDVWAAPVWPLEPRLPKGLPAHFERNAVSNACTYMA